MGLIPQQMEMNDDTAVRSLFVDLKLRLITLKKIVTVYPTSYEISLAIPCYS